MRRKLQPLTLKEVKIKEDLKQNMLVLDSILGKEIFNTLCKMEDFEIEYWELYSELKNIYEIEKEHQKVNGMLRKENNDLQERLNKTLHLIEYVNDIKEKYTNYNKGEKDYLDKIEELLRGV